MLGFLLLVLATVAGGVSADTKHPKSAWSIHRDHSRLWNKMHAAVSPEAARYAEWSRNKRADDEYADREYEPYETVTPERFDAIVGRYDDDEPTIIFEHMLNLAAAEEWTLLEHTFTHDVRFIDHTESEILSGAKHAVDRMQRDIADQKRTCLRIGCSAYGYAIEHVATQGPVVVFRVTNMFNTTHPEEQSRAAAPWSRTLSMWSLILRPPAPDRALASSQIAVVERMSSSLRADYKPPSELFDQARTLDAYVKEYTAHWHEVHRIAISEQEEALVRNMKFGAADPEHWAKRAHNYCKTRQERGETTVDFDCDYAQTAFKRQAELLQAATRDHKRRRAQ